jgi:hypothetical protein
VLAAHDHLEKSALAERLEDKLDDDYLLWYDVPVGPQQLHPDFIVLHPSRGLLILEVKDFRLSTIVQADKEDWTILDAASSEPKTIQSPFAQARNYAIRCSMPCAPTSAWCTPMAAARAKWCLPGATAWCCPTSPASSSPKRSWARPSPHRVICSDEMTDSVEPETFQSRLWEMFPYERYHTLTLPQIDRVRWISSRRCASPSRPACSTRPTCRPKCPTCCA